MKFQEGLIKSEFFFIKGKKGTLRLLLSFWIAKIQEIERLLVLSFENRTLYEKELSNFKVLLQPAEAHYIQRSNYLTLKKSAEELKKKYGYALLLEDIKSAVKKFSSQMVIIYLLDLFYKLEDAEEADIFVDELFDFCKKEGLRLVIVCDEENEYTQPLFHKIENYVDCQLSLKKEEQTTLIEVQSCIFPLERTSYRFGIQNKNISLENVEMEEIGVKQRILLLSENEYIARFHRYLLEDEKSFSLQEAHDMAQIFEELLSHPDSLIYFEKRARSDFEVCTLSKKYDLSVMLFLDKEFIRREDQIQALERGCVDVLPLNFSFEDYIATFQKNHQNFFYTKKLSQLPDKKIVAKEEFYQEVNLYLQQGIFFTLVKVEKKLAQDKAKLLRSKDLFFQDAQASFIVVVNVRKIHMEPLFKKLQIDPKEATILEALELKGKNIEELV